MRFQESECLIHSYSLWSTMSLLCAILCDPQHYMKNTKCNFYMFTVDFFFFFYHIELYRIYSLALLAITLYYLKKDARPQEVNHQKWNGVYFPSGSEEQNVEIYWWNSDKLPLLWDLRVCYLCTLWSTMLEMIGVWFSTTNKKQGFAF